MELLSKHEDEPEIDIAVKVEVAPIVTIPSSDH
jgi:hypothetical protein